MNFIRFVFALVLVFSLTLSRSQTGGNNPNSINWCYIDSKYVKVIFPKGCEKHAFRIAGIINYISDSASIGIGNKRRHLDLVLQTNQVISNGYVALAPFRSEFYSTGIQNLNWLGSLNWLDVLAIHEYRHALQFSNTKRGLTKFFYFLAGETAWSIAMNIAIPNWYLEGDAVFSETQLSSAGRGRTPFFFKEQRAQLLDNKRYSYQKARNGSFKTLMPDHYRLGFAIINQISVENGQEVWATALNKGAAYKGLFYPFSHNLKKLIGYSTKTAYKKAYDSLSVKWNRELLNLDLKTTEKFNNVNEKIPVNYDWPFFINDSTLLCRRESFNTTPELVLLTKNKINHLANIGYSVVDPYLFYFDSVLVWTELQTDLRWQNRNYSVVKKFDLKTNKVQQLTNKSKYFSPALNNDNTKIAVVRTNELIENKIILLNAFNGKEVDSIPNTLNDFISYPRWTQSNDEIIYVAKRNSKIAILKHNFKSEEVIELTPWSYNTIEGISVGKQFVYFSAGYSGIDNIYAVDLNGNKKIIQISSVKIGAYMPSVNSNENKLVFSEFGTKGYYVSAQKLDMDTSKTINIVDPEIANHYFYSENIATKNILTNEFSGGYEVKNYNGLLRGLKLHSWSFIPDQVSNQISLKADNILNDVSAEINGGYNRNEAKYFINGHLTYSRFYLPVSFGLSNLNRKTKFAQSHSDTLDWLIKTTSFTELNTYFRISLPLMIKRGYNTTKIITHFDTKYIVTNNYLVSEIKTNKKYDFVCSDLQIYISNLRGKAYQNVYPKYGQELEMKVGGDWKGQYISRYIAEATLYFPSFFKNHGFKLNMLFKKEDTRNSYLFEDKTKHSRGYSALYHDEEIKFGIDYQLPLFYPDWGLGGIAYFQRIRLDLFYDYSEVYRYGIYNKKNLNSLGIELYFDNKYFNTLPLSFGTRLSFMLNKDFYNNSGNFFEFFISGAF